MALHSRGFSLYPVGGDERITVFWAGGGVSVRSGSLESGRTVTARAGCTEGAVAWGELADRFVAGHERAVVPFGEGSPFEKLYEREAKILCIDTGFESIAFTHFVEDRIRDRIGVPLYEEDIYTGMVIDTEGRQIVVPTRVISDQAREARCEERFIRMLERRGEISRRRIGNTRLLLVNCKAMVAAAERMYREGDYFFAPPER